MSNGEDADEQDAAADGAASDEGAGGSAEDGGDANAESESTPATVEAFEERLDAVADDLAAAETEADLDTVEERLDDVATALESATFAKEQAAEDADTGDEAEGDGDDEDGPDSREALEERLADLRSDLEGQRGPYATTVTDDLDGVASTIETSEYTVEGRAAVADALEDFLQTASETLGEAVAVEGRADEVAGEDTGTMVEALEAVTADIEDASLDPDADAEGIATLLEAAESLATAAQDAQVFSDLEKREQLDRQGFYDVLTPKNRTDFPPEWNAIKLYEARGEPGPILTALEMFDSDFMEDNALDALEHLAPAEAYEDVMALAERRNEQPVRILGRIGDERACDTLEDFLGGGDTALEKTTLRALGAIGSEDSTEPVAQRLAADNPDIRSAAARSLGLVGDTRAIDPLADRLAEDDAEAVRASAAWALVQIGTERAHEAVRDYREDRSVLVQAEAEKAAPAGP